MYSKHVVLYDITEAVVCVMIPTFCFVTYNCVVCFIYDFLYRQRCFISINVEYMYSIEDPKACYLEVTNEFVDDLPWKSN